MINIPKGTKDVLPADSYRWQLVELAAREQCLMRGFREIRTPVFEHTQLFTRSIGEDTDVAGKEMYTFLDKGGRSITLKPEGTASVARSYIENSLENESLPLKMYYLTPVFRYERPQAGRLREHHQFGVEVYGGDTPLLDYEVIDLAHSYLMSLNVPDLELHINSIGCPACRKRYNEILKEYLKGKLGELCTTCGERFDRNPLRIIDCKVPACQAIVADAPKIYDHICPECRKHMDGLTAILEKQGIPYKLDKSIVRGLDYYTKTVFEFVTTSLGAQGTVCGGGRYNNLVESVGGKSTPCVGFGMGLERLLMLIDSGFTDVIDKLYRLNAFVIAQSDEYVFDCLRAVRDLRENGVSADMDFMGRSVKAQMKYADKRRARFVIVIGETERTSGIYTVKHMDTGESASIAKNELASYIFGRFESDHLQNLKAYTTDRAKGDK